MPNAFDPLSWLTGELELWRERGLARRRVIWDERDGVELTVAGRTLVNFGSNDYLNLAGEERVIAAAVEAARLAGWGAGASPLVTGYSTWHARLEQQLARFKQTEAALLFSSGFAANFGVLSAIVGADDLVFSDARNHASLIDGCRLSKAQVVVYPHCDWRQLDALMAAEPRARRRLIATDTIFSMDGDAAPLAELAEIAERRRAMLLVDEAHAMGLLGERGSGLVEALGLEHAVALRIGTLSKAVGSVGGFVAGSAPLVEWLVNRARPYVFSTAIPPAAAAAATASLAIIEAEPGRRQGLLARAAQFRQTLSAQGWNIGRSCSQIVPIYLGDPHMAMQMGAALRERGFWCPGIRPPSVPEGESLIRVSLTSGHTQAHLDALVAALADCRHELASVRVV